MFDSSQIFMISNPWDTSTSWKIITTLCTRLRLWWFCLPHPRLSTMDPLLGWGPLAKSLWNSLQERERSRARPWPKRCWPTRRTQHWDQSAKKSRKSNLNISDLQPWKRVKRSWVKVNSPPLILSLSLSLSRSISLIFRSWFISSRGHWAMQQICALIPFMSPPLIYNCEVFHIEAANHLYHNSQPQDTMSRMKQLEETPQAFQGRAHRSRGSRPHLLAPCRERWWNRNSLREMMRVADFLNAIQNGKSGHSKIQTVHFYLRFGPSHLAQHPTQKKVFS